MTPVSASVEFFYSLGAAMGEESANLDLEHFMSEDMPQIFQMFSDWQSINVVSRTNPYRRNIIEVRGQAPCFIDAILRADGVVELERISFDWKTWVPD